MNKKVSLTIPCFNQAALFEKELTYLEKQTSTDYTIIVVDNNSDQDYRKVVSLFPNQDIIYTRNDKNIGMMRNLFKSIFYPSNSLYTISLHEDDILHPQYIEKAVEILDKDKDIAFVISIADWFKDEAEFEKKFAERKEISQSSILNKADFVREIINGKHLMFGSVMYRNSMLDKNFDVEKILAKYDILADRPFLISLIKNGLKVAIIEDKGMFVKDHWENDKRAATTSEEHCFHMMNFYRENLPQPLSPEDCKKFMTFSTNNLLNTYTSIQNKNTNFYKFVKEGMKLNLINFRYINTIGIVGILKTLFGKKYINKMIRAVKSFTC